jgi:hypothetical protein
VSSTGVVSDENLDWISGNASITDTSKFSMAINPGIFSVNPNCTVSMSADISGVSQSAVLDLLSATTIQQRVRTLSGGGKSAQPFTISCQKQGADYHPKTAKIASSIGVVYNSVSERELSNVRVESCKINSHLTIDNASGLCGWIQSVSRPSTGVANITISSEVFSTIPNCTVSPADSSTNGGQSAVIVNSKTSITTYGRNVNGTIVNQNQYIMCMGKRH